MMNFQFLYKLLGRTVVQGSVYFVQASMCDGGWAARLKTVEEEERGVTCGSMESGIVGKGQGRQPFCPVGLGASDISTESNFQSLVLSLCLAIMLWVVGSG